MDIAVWKMGLSLLIKLLLFGSSHLCSIRVGPGATMRSFLWAKLDGGNPGETVAEWRPKRVSTVMIQRACSQYV